MSSTRRSFLLELSTAVVACAASPMGLALGATPRQPAGPFYPEELPLDHDNDLVRVTGQQQPAVGRISDLSGRLLDINGKPLHGVGIEIWQCDANGRYRHPRDNGRRRPDAGFQGFGRTTTDAGGRYRFRTIRPVAYPGRAPHIHVAVRPDGVEPFVTQLYVAGDPLNAGDFLYRRIAPERRARVTTAFVDGATPQEPLQARWDIVLGEI